MLVSLFFLLFELGAVGLLHFSEERSKPADPKLVYPGSFPGGGGRWPQPPQGEASAPETAACPRGFRPQA